MVTLDRRRDAHVTPSPYPDPGRLVSASLAANPIAALDNGCFRSHTRSPIFGFQSLFRRLYALA